MNSTLSFWGTLLVSHTSCRQMCLQMGPVNVSSASFYGSTRQRTTTRMVCFGTTAKLCMLTLNLFHLIEIIKTTLVYILDTLIWALKKLMCYVNLSDLHYLSCNSKSPILSPSLVAQCLQDAFRRLMMNTVHCTKSNII